MTKIGVEQEWPLADFTSWKVGGKAEFYCAPKSKDELISAIVYAQEQSLPVTVLGGGTNALISDHGIKGLVIHTIHLNKMSEREEGSDLVVVAETGALKSDVLKIFMKQRLAPAIFLAGLPGDMGGGVVMNAGVGHKVAPREFCEIVRSFTVLRVNSQGQVEEKSFPHSQVEWHYRRSQGWQPGIIYSVEVTWPNQPDDEVLVQVRQGNKRRKETQPLNLPSCGSVFKNPEGDHAGRLIEVTGLKGLMIGGAQVSDKHANFIVNVGGATADDIHHLMDEVQTQVEKQHNISLTNEVVYMGDWSHLKKHS